MQCVILAAGKGTRMGERTKDASKALLEMGGKAILKWDLEALPDEIDEVILVIGYLGEKIKEKFGNELTSPSIPPTRGGKRNRDSSPSMGEGRERVIKIKYVEQKELKGTAHALRACKDILKDRFLVFYGDDIYAKEDLEKLVQEPLAILVWEMKEEDLQSKKQAGTVKINNKGELVDIIERAPLRVGILVNAGAYVLNTKLFNYPLVSAGIPGEEFGLPQTFLQMAKNGAKFKVIQATKWKKVVGPEDLKQN